MGPGQVPLLPLLRAGPGVIECKYTLLVGCETN